MTLPLQHEREISAPNGRSIFIQSAGEHRMASEHIEFVPSESIEGVNRFFTTNGRAFFDQSGGCFYLFDSSLIIRINAENWQASCMEGPRPFYFESISISDGNLKMVLYSSGGGLESQSRALCDIDWTCGLGSAADGVFSSAYGPWVKEQELLR